MENAQPKPLGVLLCRLFWVLLGPVGVFLTAASIAFSGSGWLTGKDLLFAAFLLATILCRWGDFLKGNVATGRTAPDVTSWYPSFWRANGEEFDRSQDSSFPSRGDPNRLATVWGIAADPATAEFRRRQQTLERQLVASYRLTWVRQENVRLLQARA